MKGQSQRSAVHDVAPVSCMSSMSFAIRKPGCENEKCPKALPRCTGERCSSLWKCKDVFDDSFPATQVLHTQAKRDLLYMTKHKCKGNLASSTAIKT